MTLILATNLCPHCAAYFFFPFFNSGWTYKGQNIFLHLHSFARLRLFVYKKCTLTTFGNEFPEPENILQTGPPVNKPCTQRLALSHFCTSQVEKVPIRARKSSIYTRKGEGVNTEKRHF